MRLSLAALAALLTTPVVPAQTYTWDGPTSGLTFWGTTPFWNPDGIPGTADTAVVPSVTGSRTIEINLNSPPTGVGALDLQQTVAGGLNQLTLRRGWSIATATTLTASAGTAELRFLHPGTTNSFTLSVPNGLTVGPGGKLSTSSPLIAGGQNLQLGGNLAQTGGEIALDAPVSPATFAGLSTQTSNTYTLSGGTLTLFGNAGGPGAFFNLGGTFAGTGGVVQMGPNASFRLGGASNSIGGGVAFQNVGGGAPTNGQLALGRETSQSLTADTALPALTLIADQTATRTVGRSSPAQTLTVQRVTFQGGSLGQTLNLASSLATAATSGSPLGSTGSGNRTVALSGNTLDLTSTGTVWAPTTAGTAGWAVIGAAGSGVGGRVRAAGFDFAGPAGGVTVGANVTLEATGGDGAVLNLTNTAANPYDPTSRVAYTGTASAASPAVLTTNRPLGGLSVTNPFGPNTLRVDTPATLAGDLRVDNRLQLNGVVVTLGGSADLTGFGIGGTLVGSGVSAQLAFGGGATGGINLAGVSAPYGALTLSGTFASTAVSLADTSISRFDISTAATDRVDLAGNGIRYAGTLAVTLSGTLSTAGPADFPLFANAGAGGTSGNFSAVTLSGGNSSQFTAAFNPATGVLSLTPVPEPGLLLAVAAGGLLVRRRRRR